MGFAIYAFSFNNEFLLDDESQILNNHVVHDLTKWPTQFTSSTMADGSAVGGIYYKPIMMITYSVIWSLGQPNPFLFHVFQLLLHIINSFFVFLIFTWLFKNSKKEFSFLAGLLFLVHPINSEAVLFIADMQEPLYTFFGLAALLILSRFHSKKSVILVGLFLLCSLLSKESGILYVIASANFVLIFRKKQFPGFLISAVAAVSIYLTLRFGLAGLHSVLAHDMQIARADLSTRWLTMPKVLIHYIHLFFYPSKIALTQDWVVNSATLEDFWIPLCEVFIIICLISFFIFRKKDKIFIFFAIWFLAGWGLHSQFVPLDGTVSDRWFYFTFIGLIGMILSLFKYQFSKILLLASLIIVLILGYRTYLRSFDWRNPATLYQKDLLVDPNSFYMNNNLGLGYFAAGKYAEAIPYFEKTISVSASNSRAKYTAQTNLGAAYYFMGNFPKAESVLREVIISGDIKAYRALSGALVNQGKITEANKLIAEALEKFPNDSVLLKLKALNP